MRTRVSVAQHLVRCSSQPASLDAVFRIGRSLNPKVKQVMNFLEKKRVAPETMCRVNVAQHIVRCISQPASLSVIPMGELLELDEKCEAACPWTTLAQYCVTKEWLRKYPGC